LYLMFLDSDDIIATWCLDTRVKIMEANRSLDFSVYQSIAFKRKPGDSRKVFNRFDQENDLEQFIFGSNPWPTSAPLFRNNFLKSGCTWDVSFKSSQEWGFFIKILLKNPIYYKDNSLPDCFIRQHDGIERIASNYFKQEFCSTRLDSYLVISKILQTQFQKRLLLKRLYHETLAIMVFEVKFELKKYFRIGLQIGAFQYSLKLLCLGILHLTDNALYCLGLIRKHQILASYLPKGNILYSYELDDLSFDNLIRRVQL